MAWRKKKVLVVAPEWTDKDTEAYLWCVRNANIILDKYMHKYIYLYIYVTYTTPDVK